MDPTVVIFAALFGLVVGSFLNVVIARLPLDDPAQRRLGGRSRCPRCGHQIAGYDNVPVVSWLLLRGRCRHCRAPIAARYPLVELLTGALWAAVAASSGDWRIVVPGIVFMTLLVPVTFIDLDHRIIPNAITYPAWVVGMALSIGLHPGSWLETVLSSLLAALFLLVAALVKPGGMGMGDVKLAAVMGAFLGAPVAIAMFAGFLLALVPSLVLIAIHGLKARTMAIPFGPFLCGGSVIGWFAGEALLRAYLDGLR